MYFLAIAVEPTEEHPDHATLGECLVSCWIEREAIEDAIAVAKAMILEKPWRIIRIELVQYVTEADYDEDDDHTQYFEQALIDKEVLVFNTSPRYPVYHMEFTLKSDPKGDGPGEARAWIVNYMVDEEYDHYAPDFWSGERAARAVSTMKEAIREHGYEVDEVTHQGPYSRDESSEDCQYYDDAEDQGMCLVFIHDSPE